VTAPARRRPGRVRRGLDDTLRGLDGAEPVVVALARSLADVADDAVALYAREAAKGRTAKGDPPTALNVARASAELREVLVLLGIGPVDPGPDDVDRALRALLND